MRAWAASAASSTEVFGVVKSISASALAISGSGSSPRPKLPDSTKSLSRAMASARALLMRPERPAMTALMLMRSLRPQMLDEVLHNRLPKPRQGNDQGRRAHAHQRCLVERPFRRLFDPRFIGKQALRALRRVGIVFQMRA